MIVRLKSDGNRGIRLDQGKSEARANDGTVIRWLHSVQLSFSFSMSSTTFESAGHEALVRESAPIPIVLGFRHPIWGVGSC